MENKAPQLEKKSVKVCCKTQILTDSVCVNHLSWTALSYTVMSFNHTCHKG